MSFWNGKKALVTETVDFIGSNLIEHLVELGVKVRAFTRYQK